MKNGQRSTAQHPPVGRCMMVAFLVGAALGGVSVWFASSTAASAFRETGGNPNRPVQTEETVGRAPSADTTPVSVGTWAVPSAPPSPAFIKPPLETSGRVSDTLAAGGSWGRPTAATARFRATHWAFAATGILLGAVATGALTSLWLTRRAMARMEVRLRQFERLVADRKDDWLAHLDRDLDGEWQDQP